MYGNALNANEVCHWMLMRKCLLAMLMLVILMLLNLNTGYADTDTDLCIRILSLYCNTNDKYIWIIKLISISVIFSPEYLKHNIQEWSDGSPSPHICLESNLPDRSSWICCCKVIIYRRWSDINIAIQCWGIISIADIKGRSSSRNSRISLIITLKRSIFT